MRAAIKVLANLLIIAMSPLLCVFVVAYGTYKLWTDDAMFAECFKQ